MKRVTLLKYGFERWPEQDFSDDGNRFTCFKAGKKVRVSKLVSDGEIYLSIDSSCGKGTLPYDIYSTLPHYRMANWDFNGVSVASLTEDDIQRFYEACIAYEQEYENAEASIEYPSYDQIRAKAASITSKRLFELFEVQQLLAKHSLEITLKFTTYDWKALQEYIVNMDRDAKRHDPDTYPDTILNTSYSFDFIKNSTDSVDGFYYSRVIGLLEKYGIK